MTSEEKQQWNKSWNKKILIGAIAIVLANGMTDYMNNRISSAVDHATLKDHERRIERNENRINSIWTYITDMFSNDDDLAKKNKQKAR